MGQEKAAAFSPPRRFIRHTAGVPIEVRTVRGREARRQPTINISEGGLSFVSEEDIPVGTTIEIRIAEVDPPFEAKARVVWVKGEDDGYCIGVQFLDAADAFRSRMVEQVCAIEQYRREVEEQEGRVMTQAEAAQEWITKFAGRFPTS
ncbi:MAG TPA: PilZ domain-containing protein [Longimicrobiales bacterium]|nr:PilZ domain-containing protein [Longimicrobiales bacterium]